MPDEKLTPEQYAEMMRKNKPHLIVLEDEAQRLEYGTMEVTMYVRAGVVNKIDFHSTKTWMPPKKT